ncbi:MFS transporter [Sphingosinicella sp. CPCC 101087]|uniref:MFS transporter n=1 Tax=Sphingosinicella sp. CPCC 101087 TaxID=2497754 RepID=UPI001FB15BD8|nr:MFS transporter [Sphingosinicella sp. CPCC 101087]
MDPRETILERPMGRLQIAAVGVCIALNALDGFDVLSISFASPGIASEWGIERDALGIVLSMELIGMAVGSILLGNVADRIGRRPMILGCLVVMAAGMALAATAQNVVILSVYRLLTGLGIGGMLAAINAMTAEFSNRRRRALAVAIMASGYPIGAVIGGSIASMLLASFDWRSVFVFGALVTASFIPIVWFLLPESIEFLIHKRPANALATVNRTMARMGHPPVDRLPDPEPRSTKASMARLFAPGLARLTVLVSVAYFLHIMTFYFVLKWIPKIVVDMGFAPSAAGGVLVWANVGGATGALLFGLLTQRVALQPLIIAFMLMSAVMVTIFGHVGADLGQLALVTGIAGFFTNAVIVGLYALFAQSFPTELRAGGTGFAVGTGRGGSVVGPIVAGFLFTANYGLPTVAMIMALGSLFAAVAIFALRTPRPQPAGS